MSSHHADCLANGTGQPKRRKVSQACVYCKRSHMTCDEARPCRRCILRSIGALCRNTEPPAAQASRGSAREPAAQQRLQGAIESSQSRLARPELPLMAELLEPEEPATLRHHLEVPDGLETIKESSFSLPSSQSFRKLAIHPPNVDPKHLSMLVEEFNAIPISQEACLLSQQKSLMESAAQNAQAKGNEFLYAAADPRLGSSPTERLDAVLENKYEAGLLKPYSDGPAHQRAMDYCEMSGGSQATADKPPGDSRGPKRARKASLPMPGSKLRDMWLGFHFSVQQILAHLSELDLLHVEEFYERSMIELDRYLSFLSTPTCVWRRNGEIVKCNRAFSRLVHCQSLAAGLGIYELLDYESYYNYIEKMVSIAFDTTQKAVLTAANLLVEAPGSHNYGMSSTAGGRATAGHRLATAFSFTIKRDLFLLPCFIIGQFIPMTTACE